MINSNIYFNQRQAASPVDSFKKGYTLGDIMRGNMKSRELEKRKENNRKTFRDLVNGNMSTGPDGQFNVNLNAVAKGLMPTDPEKGMEVYQGLEKKRVATKKWNREEERQKSKDGFDQRKVLREEAKARQTQSNADRTYGLKQGELDLKTNKSMASKRGLAKNEKKFSSRFGSILAEADHLKKMINDKGTYEAFGAHNQLLAQSIDSMAIDAAKLFDPESVARESEVAAFRKMFFEAGSMSTRNSTAINTIDGFKRLIIDRANREAKLSENRGFQSQVNRVAGGQSPSSINHLQTRVSGLREELRRRQLQNPTNSASR